jgi:hypothetical protein
MTARQIRKLCSRFPTRFAVAAALLSVVAAVGACQAGRAAGPATAAAAQWTRDSARYIQDSIKWVRDSVIIDSISRTINTDSLYHLYRAQLRAENPIPLQRAIECESFRPYWIYGSMPAWDAYHRMLDTLYRPSDKVDMKRVSDRLHAMSVNEMVSLGVGTRQCGKFSLWGPKAPASISGASLDTRTGRPARPRRP